MREMRSNDDVIERAEAPDRAEPFGRRYTSDREIAYINSNRLA